MFNEWIKYNKERKHVVRLANETRTPINNVVVVVRQACIVYVTEIRIWR